MTSLQNLVELVDQRGRGQRLPYLALEHIQSGTGKLAIQDLPEKVASDTEVVTEPKDVLYGKLRPYLNKVYQPSRPLGTSPELLAFRARWDLEPRFLYYTIMSRRFLSFGDSSSYGVKMPRTSWELVRKFELEPPPLASQRRIADFRDREPERIDALIDKKRRLIDALRDQFAGSMELQIRALAEEYGETSLKFTVPQVTVGIVVTPARWYSDQGVPAIRGTNVSPGQIDTSDLVHLSVEGHALHQKSALRAGDLVVVRTGQTGSAAVVPEELDGANCIDVLLIRRATSLIPQFLEYVINSDWTRKHIEANSVGTIQSHFNVASLRELRVPVPGLAVQEAVVRRLDTEADRGERLERALTTQLDLLAEYREALITAAVTGEIDVDTFDTDRNLEVVTP